jgi:hypothetical protein
MKFGNDFDFANDLMVELLQVFCWDPILLVDSTSYLTNLCSLYSEVTPLEYDQSCQRYSLSITFDELMSLEECAPSSVLKYRDEE